MKRGIVGAALVATVALATIGGVGCGGEEPVAEPPVRTASDPNNPEVSCDTILGGARYSGTELDDRLLFDVVYVPASYRPDTAIPSGKKTWPYSADAGLIIRGDAPPVEISVPKEWRNRAAISWGNKKIVHSLRFASCPPYGLPWNAYDGSFHLRARTACVPLTFTVEGESKTIRFGVGTRCKPA